MSGYTYEPIQIMPAPQGMLAHFIGGPPSRVPYARPVVALAVCRVTAVLHGETEPSSWVDVVGMFVNVDAIVPAEQQPDFVSYSTGEP